jgi:hypothetical protein
MGATTSIKQNTHHTLRVIFVLLLLRLVCSYPDRYFWIHTLNL